MGIDFGSKRIGVAVSDELNSLAFPLKVVSGAGAGPTSAGGGAEKEILDILKEKEIETVVIGHSVDLKGNDNEIMKGANVLVDKLKQEGFNVVFEPEMFSTVQATKIQGENKDVDASAAAIILQSYLDRIKFRK